MEYKVTKANTQLQMAVAKEIERRRAMYDERDRVLHNIRRYRLMRHKVYMPKAYQRRFGGDRAVKLPIMYRLIQTAVTAVAKEYPTVYVEPINAGDRKKAEELAKGLSLLIQSLDNMAGNHYLYNFYYNIMGDGLGVLKAQPGAWSGFPLPEEDEAPAAYTARVEQFLQQRPLPFVARVVDPLLFYPPLNEYGDGISVETGQRSTSDVLSSLGLVLNDEKKIVPADPARLAREIPSGRPYHEWELPPGYNHMVQVDEIWDNDMCAVRIQGGDTWVFENPMGEKPYTWGFADPTGVMDPTNVGMSVAYPLYNLAPWIDTMVGITNAWSMLAAPTPYTTQEYIPGLPIAKDTKIEQFRPGMVYHFPTGRKPGIMEPPNVGQNLLGFLNFLIESADRGGLPALVSGSGIGTRLPALTFQAAFEAATDRLRPATQSAEQTLAGHLHKIGRIIARYEMPIKVNGWEYASESNDRVTRAWTTIKPKEAAKGRRITVSLAVESTQDLIAKGVHGMQMMDAMLWDMEKAMRFSGVKDPEKTKEKIAGDTAWKQVLPMLAQMVTDPQFQQYQQYQQEMMAQQEMQGGEGEGEGAAPPAEPAPMMAEGGVVEPLERPTHNFHRGGRPAGMPTEKPRGRRQGKGSHYGRR